MNEHSQSEIVGVALQRIGSILENDKHATVSFSEDIDTEMAPTGTSIIKKGTSVTLEVTGHDQ